MTTEPYRPSNGTEGETFMEVFCFRCERDADYQNNHGNAAGCEILARSFAFDIDDPKYPVEWVRDIGSDRILIGGCGARCTAFIERGTEVPYRCPNTPDLFPDGKGES